MTRDSSGWTGTGPLIGAPRLEPPHSRLLQRSLRIENPEPPEEGEAPQEPLLLRRQGTRVQDALPLQVRRLVHARKTPEEQTVPDPAGTEAERPREIDEHDASIRAHQRVVLAAKIVVDDAARVDPVEDLAQRLEELLPAPALAELPQRRPLGALEREGVRVDPPEPSHHPADPLRSLVRPALSPHLEPPQPPDRKRLRREVLDDDRFSVHPSQVDI